MVELMSNLQKLEIDKIFTHERENGKNKLKDVTR